MILSKTFESVVKCDFEDEKNIQIIWGADFHLDSLSTDRKAIQSLFDKYPSAYIIIGGDFSDVMQQAFDKRATKGKDRYNEPNYLNSIVDDLVSFFEPYAKRILGFNQGNHESSQIKYHGIDIQQMLVYQLNYKCGTNIQINDFAGYYALKMNIYPTRPIRYNIFFQHKPISGGSRSKGMLSADIISGRNPDADMYISEHIHTTFAHPFVVEKLNPMSDTITYYEKWYVQMPTMKSEHAGTKRGFHHERNFNHTWNGMVLLDFEFVRNTKGSKSATVICTPQYIRL